MLQVNGVNIEGMRHADVVAFIKKGGDETWLLVVDPDTDDHFKRRGVIPTVSHVKGRATPTKGYSKVHMIAPDKLVQALMKQKHL